MLVKIESDIFSSSEAFRNLRFLLDIASYKSRYDVLIEVPEINSTEQYKRLDQDDKIWIEEQFTRHIEQSNVPNYMVALNSDTSVFSLEEAIRFFNQDIIIFLENSTNDAHFMNALFNNFQDLNKEIIAQKQEGWIKYNMGGGSSVRGAINSLLESFDSLPKENHKYIRCFVLMDSDKKYPTMPLKREIQNSIDFLQSLNISYHVLEKREMENYLPDDTLQSLDLEYFNLYCNLSNQQKDYFDLEKGFEKNKDDQALDDNVLDLYQDVSSQNWSILINGFPSALYHRRRDFKPEFPKLFQDDTVTQSTLLAKTAHQVNPNELQDIIRKISQLL